MRHYQRQADHPPGSRQVSDHQPDEVVEKGRVGPCELMVIDTRGGRILHSAETDDDSKVPPSV